MDPEKIEAIKTWPGPKNLKELRSIPGFAGYYRRFIKDYSQIVKPLNDLTSGYLPLKKSCKKAEKEHHYHDPKELFVGRWTTDCQKAFKTLVEKNLLLLSWVLQTPNFLMSFIQMSAPQVWGLHYIKSRAGNNVLLHLLAEAYRIVSPVIRPIKLEFLALKWAVTEKCHDYLNR